MADLRFFESYSNVKRVIADVFGREPNTEVARGVSICLQQGSMFLDAAREAPIEIRPLLIYYGISGFAKAIVIAREIRSLATLNQAHGLSDTSAATARLVELKVKIDGQGTFQEFNDVISRAEGIQYYEHAMSRSHKLPTATSAQLDQIEITLKEILARVPGLQELYEMTFDEPAKLCSSMVHLRGSPTDEVHIRIDLNDLYADRAELQRSVSEIRARYPVLRRWAPSICVQGLGQVGNSF